MAYFECVIGSGGGDGADLIVTCSSDFAGSTITCTDGTKTFTQTCPSSSPYTVTFESIPTGTWTISGVSGGQTFSKTKTITDFTETLSAIPDGATVTPTDDIQTWLHCADIWDKNYTTIAAVLADTTTLLALISSNNAADYMARSTTWSSSVCANSTAMTYIGNNNYCANKLLADSTWCTSICNSTYFESVLKTKVPTMTSNTAPSGEVFYDTSKVTGGTSGETYYYLFSGNLQTVGTATVTTNQYFGYDFTNSNKNSLCKLAVYGHHASGNMTIEVQGSNSKTSNYQTLKSFTYTSSNSWQYFDIPFSATKYRYWRLNCTKGTIYSIALKGLQFYGRA